MLTVDRRLVTGFFDTFKKKKKEKHFSLFYALRLKINIINILNETNVARHCGHASVAEDNTSNSKTSWGLVSLAALRVNPDCEISIRFFALGPERSEFNIVRKFRKNNCIFKKHFFHVFFYEISSTIQTSVFWTQY